MRANDSSIQGDPSKLLIISDAELMEHIFREAGC